MPACVVNHRMIDRVDDLHNIGIVQVYDTAAQTWAGVSSKA